MVLQKNIKKTKKVKIGGYGLMGVVGIERGVV